MRTAEAVSQRTSKFAVQTFLTLKNTTDTCNHPKLLKLKLLKQWEKRKDGVLSIDLSRRKAAIWRLRTVLGKKNGLCNVEAAAGDVLSGTLWEVNLKFWVRFLREKRISLILYLVTVFLFLAVGGLYHIENFPKLLYAALLTLIPWGAAFIWRGIAYVGRCQKLEMAARHYEQSAELLTEELRGESGSFWNGLVDLLEQVCSAQQAERGEWEAKVADCNDYYMMWTHQIKTPIAAMKLLLENSGEGDKNSFFMREELFKIEQYVEMVLTFQRLESLSSDLVLGECDLYGVLRQTVKKFSVLFINKGLSLELQKMQLKVLTDEKWFGFCIDQLISNSIKYTRQGRISIWAREEGESVTLCVEDTGIGIRPEDLPRIFERGFTGCNGRMDEKSTGIGLYLCRRTFGHLGITVKAESEVGKGTKMILGIPVPKAAKPLII